MGVQSSITGALGAVAGLTMAEKQLEGQINKEIEGLKKEDASLQKEEAGIPLEEKKASTELLNIKDEKAINKNKLMQGDINKNQYNIANRNAKLKAETIKFQKEQLKTRLGEIQNRRQEIDTRLSKIGGK